MTLCIASHLLLGVEDLRLVREIERHLSNALHPYAMLGAVKRLAWLGPASPQATGRRCRAAFARGLSQVSAARAPRPGGGQPDALAVLSTPAGTGPPLEDAQIAGELFALLLAGHETTATSLAWALKLLARDPGTTAALAATQEQPLMDAVITELLRMRPPLVDIVREVTEPVQLGGRRLAAGTTLLIPPPVIHQHGYREPDRSSATDSSNSVPISGRGCRSEEATGAVWEHHLHCSSCARSLATSSAGSHSSLRTRSQSGPACMGRRSSRRTVVE